MHRVYFSITHSRKLTMNIRCALQFFAAEAGRLFAIVIACAIPVFSQQQPQKINVAVINLKNASGVNEGEAAVISDRLRAELFNTGKVNVMERDQMQEILKEQGFQASGACTDEACMVEMGQLLGVKGLVSGSIGKLGSMFLVNIRMIDVQTGRISKAVSRDISGNIEEVVGHLSGIARELVASRKDIPEKETEPHPPPPAPESPDPESEDEPEDEPEEVSEKDVDDKNTNRSGIGLCFGLRPGGATWDFDGEFYEMSNAESEEYNSGVFVNPMLRFTIRIWKYFALDIMPNYSYSWEQLKRQNFDTLQVWDFEYHVISFHAGASYVKRWYPFKLNLGFKGGFNILAVPWTYSDDSESYYYGETSKMNDDVEVGFSGSFALRAGAEILVSPHIGFGADFILEYMSFYLADLSPSAEFYEVFDSYYSTNYSSSYGEVYTPMDTYLFIPPVNFVFSVNFYF
ncbi:MAG: hypothetical protein GF350_11065 [Chitinivibrionales bacterium]|nr:hypothetical protein [Chitinivibrionales bacterium]